jgi:hypothetical protein
MAIKTPASRKELEDQLADLKAEIVALSGLMAETVGGTVERAQPFINETGHRFQDAASAAAEHGRAVYDGMTNDPRTATSVALTAGLLGLAIGWLIGSAITQR